MIYFGYKNILEEATVTVTSEATGYPSYRLYDKDMSLLWKASSTASQTIKTDAGEGNTDTINCYLTCYHNLGDTAVSGIRLDYSDDDVVWTNILSITQSDNDLINSTFSGSTHRYFRLVFDTFGSGIAEAGEVYLGNMESINRDPAEGLDISPQYQRMKQVTTAGYPWIVENGPSKNTYSCDLVNITSAEKAIVSEACEETMFFFKDHLGDTRHYEINNLRITALNTGNYSAHIRLIETESIND